MTNYLAQIENIFKETHRVYDKHTSEERIELHLLNGPTDTYINFVFNKHGGLVGIKPEETDPASYRGEDYTPASYGEL